MPHGWKLLPTEKGSSDNFAGVKMQKITWKSKSAVENWRRSQGGVSWNQKALQMKYRWKMRLSDNLQEIWIETYSAWTHIQVGEKYVYAMNMLYSIQLFQQYALERKHLLEKRPERRLSAFADGYGTIQVNIQIKINSQKHTTSITGRTWENWLHSSAWERKQSVSGEAAKLEISSW